MASPSTRRLAARLADAKRLLEIHTEITGPLRGRRHNYDALSRSSVILAVAAWEGFNEDVLLASAAFIVRHIASANRLPANVRDGMLSHLYTSGGWDKLNRTTKDDIWGLTGEGWRNAYISYVRSKVERLHTPDYETLRKIYSSTCGLSDFTEDWGTGRWSAEHYREKLKTSLTVRHLIAHGSIGKQTVGKDTARDVIDLVERLADWTDRSVRRHLSTLQKRRRQRRKKPPAPQGEAQG